MTFPKGYGFTAVKTIEKLSESTLDMYKDLIHRGDTQTLAMLAQAKEEEENE